MNDRVLVLCGAPAQPRRVGESVRLVAGTHVLGALAFAQERPTGIVVGAPLGGAEGVTLHFDGERVVVECDRDVTIDCDEHPAGRAELPVGSTLRLGEDLLLYLTERPAMPPLSTFPTGFMRPFGEPDAVRITGESPALWAFRDALAAAAKSGEGVLLTGGSWIWNERHARAIHALSPRASGPYWFAETACAHEPVYVYGNAQTDYPGVFGYSRGGTVYIQCYSLEADEPLIAAFRKLRAYDGLYYRVHDDEPRKADFVLVIATTRDQTMDTVHPELLSRALQRVAVPPLDERREDVPLLLRAMFLERMDRDPSELETRFIATNPDGFRYSTLPLECVERLMHRSHVLRDEVSPADAFKELSWAWERDPRRERPAPVARLEPEPPNPRIEGPIRPSFDTIPPGDEMTDESAAEARADANAPRIAEWCNGWFHRGYARKDLVAVIFMRTHHRPLVMRRDDLARMMPEAAAELAEVDLPAERVAVVVCDDRGWSVRSMHVPSLDVADTRGVLPEMTPEQRARALQRSAELAPGLARVLLDWYDAPGTMAAIITADGRAHVALRDDLDPEHARLFDAADYPVEYGKLAILVLPEADEGPAVIWHALSAVPERCSLS